MACATQLNYGAGCLIFLALAGLTGLGCRGAEPTATAAEPPPPLIEPAIGPGAGLVDPRAEALVRQMSDHLARATGFAAGSGRSCPISSAATRARNATSCLNQPP